MATTVRPITGTWFSSGYHGHFRSKSRNDFVNEYRQAAKPIPPKTYQYRVKSGHKSHQFSKHDNRNSFMDDALYFEQGLGKRRIKNDNYHYKPELMMWMPHKPDFDNATPLQSTYRKDFHNRGGNSEGFNQVYIDNRPKTAFAEKSTSSYRYSHSHNKPDRGTISAMKNDGLLPIGIKKNRGRVFTAIPGERESVMSCMTWHHPVAPPTKASLPAATPITSSPPYMESTNNNVPVNQTINALVE